MTHGQARRQTWRLNTRRLHDDWILEIAANHEVRERFGRRVNLRADAAAAQPQVLEPHVSQQPARRLQKRLDGKAILFVVVLPLLKRRGWPQPHVTVGRSHEVHAQAVGVGEGIHERVDQRSLRRRQLDVFAAAGIHRERLAAQQPRDLVCEQPSRVHDRPGVDRFLFRAQLDAVVSTIGTNQASARQEDHAGVDAGRDQCLDERLGVHHA